MESSFPRSGCVGTLFAKAEVMTAPRPIHPGRYHFVTKSVLQRRFLLRPDPETRYVFEYCLAEAAERYGIRVLAWVLMSNHYHAVLFDPNGALPLFLTHFHKMTALMMNQHLGRTGQFWEREQTNVVELVDLESVLEAVVYTLANPVQNHLVERAADWPGFTTIDSHNEGSRTVARPDKYFGAKSVMPASVTFSIAVPAEFTGARDEWLPLVRRRLNAREQAVRIEREGAGRGVAGVDAVLRTSTSDTPATDVRHGALKPVVKAASQELRRVALGALRLFRRLYAKALAAFRGGARDTVFPAGTFAMRVRFNVSVAPS